MEVMPPNGGKELRQLQQLICDLAVREGHFWSYYQ
jgi:hypothetical protein